MKTNIKKLRKSLGYTQLQLQMKTGIDQSLISKFESGERVPSTETLIILAECFGTSIDYLVCRTDDPNPYKKQNKEEIG